MLREVKGREEEKAGSFYGKYTLSQQATWQMADNARHPAKSVVHSTSVPWYILIYALTTA